MQQSDATNANATAAATGDAAAAPVVRVRGVVKRFGRQVVLDGIDLDVEAGKTMVIMGGSGSGKSTLLRIMIGSIPADEGTVELFGRELGSLSESELNDMRRRFGIVFQSGALFNSMTIGENVALPIQENTDIDANIIDIQVKVKLELVRLREHIHKFPGEISGGMKKRAGLARALALDPQLLFYDEPSAGLDPVTSAEIDQLIIALSKQLEVTSVVVTHEMNSAFNIADRMGMLDKGKMLLVADRAEFLRLRDIAAAQAAQLDEREQVIRQFLRGEAEGPITARREASNYGADLLGFPLEPREPRPSVLTTRSGAVGTGGE